MNWIDKTVSYFSPAAGIQRVRARAALKVIQRFDYEGAKSGRHHAGWHRPSTSANTEIGPALARLRDSSRDLYRNNPLARKAIKEIETKTVGTGLIPQSRAKNLRTREKLDTSFEKWSQECDASGRLNYFGLQSLACKTIIEGGEALIRFRDRLPKDGLTIPLQVQLMEGDYLDLSKTQVTATGFILQGVDFDKLERRRGYWLFGSHPGDVVNTGWYKRGAGLVSAFVPASEIEHGYEMERATQVRGVPRCAPVIIAMRDMDEYEEAVRIRKKIEACIALIVTNSGGTSEDRAGIGIGSTDAATGERAETLEPGMIQYLSGDKNIQFTDPKSSGAEPDYVRLQQRIIAAGWQVPYEILTGDLSQINYSSYRGGLLGFRDMIVKFRWDVLIPFIGDPVWKRFVDYAFAQGIVGEIDYAVEWGEPKFDLLDREKEADADRAELRIGTKTWPQAVAAQGYDPTKQLSEIADWNKRLDAEGIILDSDPRKTTPAGKVAGQVPAQQNNAEQMPVHLI